MLKSFVFIAVILSILSQTAYANSYLEMITENPEEQRDISPAPQPADDRQTSDKSVVFIKNMPVKYPLTTSPVVTSPEKKYQAWLKAKANENNYDNTHEQIQNMIYTIEGGLVGLGIYEIYRYK